MEIFSFGFEIGDVASFALGLPNSEPPLTALELLVPNENTAEFEVPCEVGVALVTTLPKLNVDALTADWVVVGIAAEGPKLNDGAFAASLLPKLKTLVVAGIPNLNSDFDVVPKRPELVEVVAAEVVAPSFGVVHAVHVSVSFLFTT
jgi:hypothetical protein